jgi:hypothetical protein
MGTKSTDDDEGGAEAGAGALLCTGGRLCWGGRLGELVGNGGGGLQPVCSESHSIERPPQPPTPANDAVTASSAWAASVPMHPDATP